MFHPAPLLSQQEDNKKKKTALCDSLEGLWRQFGARQDDGVEGQGGAEELLKGGGQLLSLPAGGTQDIIKK